MTTSPNTTTSPNMKAVAPRPNFGLKPTRAERFPASPQSPSPAKSQPFDDDLWRRLLAMDLDEPGVAMPISKRLAKEHKWSEAETNRAIFEYKRFLYLTQRAGFEATPSRPVDLVWHEHLMHTRHYWDTLCRDVLQADLDHKPGTGGGGDGDRLMAQYTLTLDAYRNVFRCEPPAEIWPRPSVRSAWSSVPPGIFAAAMLACVFLSAASRAWPLAFVCAFAFIAALVVCINAASASDGRKNRGGCGSGCGGGGIGSTGCGDGGGAGGDGGGGDGGGGGCGGD